MEGKMLIVCLNHLLLGELTTLSMTLRTMILRCLPKVPQKRRASSWAISPGSDVENVETENEEDPPTTLLLPLLRGIFLLPLLAIAVEIMRLY